MKTFFWRNKVLINIKRKWRRGKQMQIGQKIKIELRNFEMSFVETRIYFANIVFLFGLRYFCMSLVMELSSLSFLIISVNSSSCVLSVGLYWRMYRISYQHNLLSLSAESKISTLLKSWNWYPHSTHKTNYSHSLLEMFNSKAP